MFGLFGKYQYVNEYEAAGVITSLGTGGVKRYFGMSVAAIPYLRSPEVLNFDLDGIGPTPDLKFNSALNNTSNNGVETYITGESSDIFFTGVVQGLVVDSNLILLRSHNAHTGIAFSTNAPLSPVNRKYRVSFHRPEYITVYGMRVINQMDIINSSNNLSNTSELFDLRGFDNLETFLITNSFFGDTLTFRFNEKINNFYISSSSVTTINGSLPASVKTISLGISITSINQLIENCNMCELLSFGHPSGGYSGLINTTSTLSGILDIEHLNNLKVLTIPQNNNLNNIIFPNDNSNWEWFHLNGASNNLRNNIIGSDLNNILSCQNLKIFYFFNNRYIWSRNIINDDINNQLVAFNIGLNTISGSISITDEKVNLREFSTSNNIVNSANQQNNFTTVNITGLTQVRLLDLSSSGIEQLTLPENTVCTVLALQGNKLDVIENPNLINQVNAMTGLVALRFSQGNTNASLAIGQDSTNGLGEDLDLTPLVNVTQLYLSNCKLKGTLTLPNSTNRINDLQLFSNPLLEGINNISNHNTLNIRATNCNSLNVDLSTLTSYNQISISHWVNEVLDISGRTTTAFFSNSSGGFNVTSCPNLTTIIFPIASNRFTFGTVSIFNINNNPLLSTVTNLNNCVMNSGTFNAFNCSLDIEFPFSSTFRPTSISINNNNMGISNVDATINNIYTVRSSFVTSAKSINIAGSNAAPSGTFQAPTGFVLGVSDGTPASAKEQVFVLINNYNWSITMN
jgi:hypothetical protein